MNEWKTYRTRFLVNAKQLTSPLSFVDHLGRQHCGRKGDYLVESSDGVLSIAPRRIFEDIYVSMPSPGAASAETEITDRELTTSASASFHSRLGSFKPLTIEHIQLKPSSRRRERSSEFASPDHSAPRKLPQPCRDRRPSLIGMM